MLFITATESKLVQAISFSPEKGVIDLKEEGHTGTILFPSYQRRILSRQSINVSCYLHHLDENELWHLAARFSTESILPTTRSHILLFGIRSPDTVNPQQGGGLDLFLPA